MGLLTVCFQHCLSAARNCWQSCRVWWVEPAASTTLGLQWVRDGWVASVGVEAGSCFDGSALPCGFSCNKYRPFMCELFFFLVLLWSSRWGFYWQADHRGMEYAGSPVCWILCLVLLGCGVLWFFFFLTTYMPLTLGPSSVYASHLGLITVSVPLVCLSADFSPTLYY